jgi:hypothetical protein
MIRKEFRVTFWTFDPLQIGPIGCTETSVRNNQQSMRNIPEECSSYVSHFFGSVCHSFKRLNSLTSFYEI